MKRLLLFDADVVIDLHSLGLFEKMCRAYEVYVTQEVYEEATYFKKGGSKNPINIAGKVTVIKDVENTTTNSNSRKKASCTIC